MTTDRPMCKRFCDRNYFHMSILPSEGSFSRGGAVHVPRVKGGISHRCLVADTGLYRGEMAATTLGPRRLVGAVCSDSPIRASRV